MPQVIKLITMMCPLGIGNPDGECRFHRSSDNLTEDGLCPIHQLPLEKTSAEEDKITVTIMDEAEVDTLIKHGDTLIPVAVADDLDTAETAKAVEETRTPKIPPRTILTQTEKDEMKSKIQADIATFQLLEDK